MTSPDHGSGFLGAVFGDRTAGDYDETVTSLRPTARIVERLSEWLAPADTLLDIGAGTGVIASGLADAGAGSVLATDVSEAMVQATTDRGHPRVRAQVHDITAGPLPIEAAGACCIFNTLFMLGPLSVQQLALSHIRDSVRGGGRLVVEVFQPNDETYEQDGLHLDPQHLDATSVRLAVSRVRTGPRVVEMQSVVITDGGIRLAPSSFHYCGVDELDDMASAARWRLEERWGGWDRQPFTPRSMNSVSVYLAV